MRATDLRGMHRWIGVVAGAALLLWTVSGVLLVLPAGTRPALNPARAAADFGQASVSPAQALRAATAAVGPLEAPTLTLEVVGDRVAYRIASRGRAPLLVDAVRGELVVVDSALAVAIARSRYSGPGEPGTVSMVRERRLGYVFGELPAFRISFDDRWGTVALVGESSGSLRWNDRRTRVRSAAGIVHDLFFLRPLPGGQALQRLAIWLLSGLALASILTGYFLWWRGVRRARSRRSK